MPSIVHVKILAARDLPVMDRTSDLTDAFAEVKLGDVTYKTDVCKKSLNPDWNSEWFDFEVDDEELQQEPLQIRILDHDTISAHNAIGKVYIDLTSLVLDEAPKGISGWYPIYDTLHGIRGELHVQIRVKFIQDINRFRQSSCGVQFFSSFCIPECYHCHALFGFVEELVVNDDPEYQWIDKIRTPRSSNEARQLLFSRLSGELRRKIGLKVLEARGNSVVGYRQRFDLEGESGIVVRAIGTIAYLGRSSHSPPLVSGAFHEQSTPQLTPTEMVTSNDELKYPVRGIDQSSSFNIIPSLMKSSTAGKGFFRIRTKSTTSVESSDSTSPTAALKDGLPGSGLPKHPLRPSLGLKYAMASEYPFFTLCLFPPGMLVNIGGLVAAHSVKLLDRINNPDEPETRDAWWNEIRNEMRSHARAMGCNAVVGYSESTSICDELCLLSAIGTAANLNIPGLPLLTGVRVTDTALNLSGERREKDSDGRAQEKDSEIGINADDFGLINPFEIPYSPTNLPFPTTLWKSPLDRRRYVPDVLLSTTELPLGATVTGNGCLIQARVCRAKKKDKGESNAVAVSDALPFLEHDLSRQLLNKLKVRQMNAVFGLRIQVSVGENMLVAVATGTAVYLAALPKSSGLVFTNKEIQEKIRILTENHVQKYNLSCSWDGSGSTGSNSGSDLEDDGRPFLELPGLTDRKANIVNVDDQCDASDAVLMLIETPEPESVYCCSTQRPPGIDVTGRNLQAFAVIHRCALSQSQEYTDKEFAKVFEDILQLLWFKLYRYAPYCLCSLRFDCDLPDEDEVVVTGIALRLCDGYRTKQLSAGSLSQQSVLSGKLPSSPVKQRSFETVGESPAVPATAVKKPGISSDDLQFQMEDAGDSSSMPSPTSQSKHQHFYVSSRQWRPRVELTPLTDISGAKVLRYLGHVNFFLIRESTSIQECGGLSAFMQEFLAEAHAIARAHVEAVGGNTLLAFRVSECVVLENQTKNQGQSLLNISGDAAEVDYSSANATFGGGEFRLGTPCSKVTRSGRHSHSHSQEPQTPKTPPIETAL
ncbi:C2 domain-containing protein 5-like isoform X2 [Corticium candelabrum]|uniref:C2 domain-containing protein 5-like isoform X2 n=1 Tax=Corticium candelabrum TaxID=121492 RepID=UPI002E268275|nr:C2 domain-containing protein 5-like isoform X2 [Corticium candelabrum]